MPSSWEKVAEVEIVVIARIWPVLIAHNNFHDVETSSLIATSYTWRKAYSILPHLHAEG